MPNKCCDLHTHSVFSDGTLTPSEILRLADAAGLAAVALTDHNTVAGLPEFFHAAQGCSVQAIPGVEISTDYLGTELHILGLFLPSGAYGPLNAFLEEANLEKERSTRDLILALNRDGYALSYEQLRSRHTGGPLNRANVASALAELGYVGSIQEAFQGLLSREGHYYVPPERIGTLDAIAFLHSLQAVPVLAHPFLNLKEGPLRHFLPEAKKQGLAALETLYSTYSPETTALARQMAREFALLESGGSDFHGQTKPHIHLGCPKVPLAFAETLKNCR